MKKKVFGLMLLLVSAVGFTACSDDEDDKQVNIEGRYLGKMVCYVTVMGRDIMTEQENVYAKISKNGDVYSITIEDFTYSDVNYGDIVVSEVLKTDEDSFVGNGECTLTKDGVDYTATIEELEGEKMGKNIEVEIDMKLPVSPKMTIIFDITYTGTEHE